MQEKKAIEVNTPRAEVEPVKIELPIGYTDKQGQLHRLVTIGARLNGKKLFQIDDDPQGQLQTQYAMLLLRASITEFGTLEMPVTVLSLLELNTIDLDALDEAQALYSARGMLGRESKQINESNLKLYFGYEEKSSGVIYDHVEFGRQTRGRDLIKADQLKLSGMRRLCFLDGLLVSRIFTEDGTLELSGPLGLEIFEQLDIADIFAIRTAAEVWRGSFRAGREKLQRDSSASGDGDSDKNRME